MVRTVFHFCCLSLVAGVLLCSRVAAELQSLYGRHVVARFHSEDVAHARAAVAAADKLAPVLAQQLGVALAERAEIVLCSTGPEFDRELRKPQPSWVVGVADPRHNRIVIRRGTVAGVEPVVRHELTHLLVARALGPAADRAPDWLHEGAATYYAGDWSSQDRAVLAEAAKAGRLHSLRELADFPAHPELSAVAYAESYVLVEYLISLAPAQGLRGFIAEFRTTQDQGRAFFRAYGLTEQQIEAGWQEAVATKIRTAPREWAAEAVGFFVMLAVFGVAYLRVRRRAREIRLRMEREEALRHPPEQYPDRDS